MRVIGTAGHVDHGKSTLIAALTGTHPDRLKEEQEREMTIDLGFGWLTLPDGQDVGIVDVPGHRDFIENMLAGIAGIDAALLVIAADEGVMPQTREHLAILDLLQIPSGLIALTKTDLAPDSEWLDLVETDIRSAVADTVMQAAPIVRVSAKSKTGLENLLAQLSEILREKADRLDLGRPRLPIDRVFSMPGFGTVVTGTLSDGHLALGEEVLVLPSNQKGRIRGLQTHKKKEDRAVPGSRTAINISGVNTEQVKRGQVVVHPDQYETTRRLDARFRFLKDASSPIKHNDEVKVFIGATETMATLRLLGVEKLNPGDSGWIQLELRDPVVAVRGDRYVLRRPSPPETLGGGEVIDHQPKGRHKRFDKKVLKSLEALAKGTPTDVLLEAALALGTAPSKDILTRSRLDALEAEPALQELLETGQLIQLENGKASPTSDVLILAESHWNTIRETVIQMLEGYHQRHPLRSGIPREELKSKLKLSPRAFNAVASRLSENGTVAESRNSIALPGHRITFDSQQQHKIQALMRRFSEAPFAPPTVKECQAEIGEEALNALVELGQLQQVSPEVVFRKEDFEHMVAKVQNFISEKGQITIADARDLLGSSRKYILALMEHLDASGVTRRDGDYRKLRK